MVRKGIEWLRLFLGIVVIVAGIGGASYFFLHPGKISLPEAWSGEGGTPTLEKSIDDAIQNIQDYARMTFGGFTILLHTPPKEIINSMASTTGRAVVRALGGNPDDTLIVEREPRTIGIYPSPGSNVELQNWNMRLCDFEPVNAPLYFVLVNPWYPKNGMGYAIDWGDGTRSDGTAAATENEVVIVHTYRKTGEYTSIFNTTNGTATFVAGHRTCV